MRAEKLFDGTDYEVLCGNAECEVESLTDDSRRVKPKSLFICVSGEHTDGHMYIGEALAAGAVAVAITDVTVHPDEDILRKGALIVVLRDGRRGIGVICNNFWANPSKHIKVIGITGTKGKTSAAYMFRELMRSQGIRTGLIGTIETDDCLVCCPSVNTTPDVLFIHEKLADMVQNGADCCVMEVSSQGLMKGRVEGVEFAVGVFTNISPDHIGKGEHSTFEEYMRWKESLFYRCRMAVINADDMYAEVFSQAAEASGIPVMFYGFADESANVRRCDVLQRCGGRLCLAAVNAEYVTDGTFMGMTYMAQCRQMYAASSPRVQVKLRLPGIFNVYNSLAAIAAGICMGQKLEECGETCEHVSVRGRMEYVCVSDAFTVVIDYAHNAVSLMSALQTLRRYNPRRIICLFGCGGNRDRDRRTQMGLISGKMAELTIVTGDNPRYEAPETIMRDIESGVAAAGGEYVVIEDRKEAIRYALTHANEKDVVLLAGKGHESYQEIQGHRFHMDERELIREILYEEDTGDICGRNHRYIP